MLTRVQGGTGAGTKRAPKIQNKKKWQCPECHQVIEYYWANCPNCGRKRPNG